MAVTIINTLPSRVISAIPREKKVLGPKIWFALALIAHMVACGCLVNNMDTYHNDYVLIDKLSKTNSEFEIDSPFDAFSNDFTKPMYYIVFGLNMLFTFIAIITVKRGFFAFFAIVSIISLVFAFSIVVFSSQMIAALHTFTFPQMTLLEITLKASKFFIDFMDGKETFDFKFRLKNMMDSLDNVLVSNAIDLIVIAISVIVCFVMCCRKTHTIQYVQTAAPVMQGAQVTLVQSHTVPVVGVPIDACNPPPVAPAPPVYAYDQA